MSNHPDTLLVTGPNFEQEPIDYALVTPTGGVQLTLRDALAFGANLTMPGPIGSVTPNTGAFTTLSDTGTTTLLQNTGRDLTIIDETTRARINVANGNPLWFGPHLEIASTQTPQNATEFNILGFSGNTIPLSGSQTYTSLATSAVLSGTSTADTFVNKMTTQGNGFVSSGPNGLFGFTSSVVMGNSAGGAYTGIQGLATVNGTGVTNANAVGVEANTNATVNVGGVSGTTSGNAYGAYLQATLGSSSATFWTNLVGVEIDVSAVAGSSVNTKTGVSVVALPSDAVAGFKGRDSAFAIGQGAGGALGWDYAFRINGVSGTFPIKSTGSLLGIPVEGGIVNGGTIANGFDLTNLTITNNAWKSTGTTIDGSGNGTFASVRTTSSSGPTWTSGTGAPGTTQPKGSIWSRTDGGVGTTLYISQGGGTWNPIAGV